MFLYTRLPVVEQTLSECGLVSVSNHKGVTTVRGSLTLLNPAQGRGVIGRALRYLQKLGFTPTYHMTDSRFEVSWRAL